MGKPICDSLTDKLKIALYGTAEEFEKNHTLGVNSKTEASAKIRIKSEPFRISNVYIVKERNHNTEQINEITIKSMQPTSSQEKEPDTITRSELRGNHGT